jgi:predicted RNA binding protein YcfA (HicA-like mRNA interferase family)
VPKAPVLKPREVSQILLNLGFEEVRQRGSHKQYRHADGRATTVPHHAGVTSLRSCSGKSLATSA